MKNALFGHEDAERDRGVLSPSDREYLVTGGENLKSDQSRRNTRRRIRHRIRNAIIDFDLITRLLADEDRDLVFEEDGEWEPVFQAGQKAMVEFLYSGLAESGAEVDFETILKSGVHDAEIERHDGPVFVNVEFDVETDVQFDIDSAVERFESGAALTVSEIGALIATGKVDDPEEMAKLADLAQEKGVVESSVSPMQAAFFSGPLGSEERTHIPAGDERTRHETKYLIRGEPAALMGFTDNDADDADDETE
jgi:hypothetical protein